MFLFGLIILLDLRDGSVNPLNVSLDGYSTTSPLSSLPACWITLATFCKPIILASWCFPFLIEESTLTKFNR